MPQKRPTFKPRLHHIRNPEMHSTVSICDLPPMLSLPFYNTNNLDLIILSSHISFTHSLTSPHHTHFVFLFVVGENCVRWSDRQHAPTENAHSNFFHLILWMLQDVICRKHKIFAQVLRINKLNVHSRSYLSKFSSYSIFLSSIVVGKKNFFDMIKIVGSSYDFLLAHRLIHVGMCLGWKFEHRLKKFSLDL